jgi:hypothetical protein
MTTIPGAAAIDYDRHWRIIREVRMSNQRGEIIIGAIVVMMVAMVTMMFVGMPMMHGGHQHGGADQKNMSNDGCCAEAIQRTHECDKELHPVPLQEKPAPAL